VKYAICLWLLIGCTIGEEPCAGCGDSSVHEDAGRAICTAGALECDGDAIERCRDDGSGFDVVAVCDPSAGTFCRNGVAECDNPCADAEVELSNVGCDHWPVTLLSSVLYALPDEYPIGIVVVASSPYPTEVAVSRGTVEIARLSLAPGDVEPVVLPDIPELVRRGMAPRSALARQSAYHLRSTAPVTVYQFNPLERSSGAKVASNGDASLLVPASAMGSDYMTLGWPSLRIVPVSPNPAFITVVAVDPGTTELDITPTADVLGSLDNAVMPIASGDVAHFTLEQGDVLQLVVDVSEQCDALVPIPGAALIVCDQRSIDTDLSGTIVHASARVGVYSGADCAFVPWDRPYCNHIEEMLPPLRAWGREAVIARARTTPVSDTVLRVISGADDNTVTFDPPVREPIVLGRGEMIELTITESVHVEGSGALLAGQYLVGQGTTANPALTSDPGFAVSYPSEQFRTEYAFYAPERLARHFAGIAAPLEAIVRLDGRELEAGTPIGASGWQELRVEIDSGVHHLSSTLPVGLVGYGADDATSYLYPAGADLSVINLF
jgi:hypothetical protein